MKSLYPAAIALSLSLCAALAGVSCSGSSSVQASAEKLTGGHVVSGRQKIGYYGCGSCHTIPGIINANALVGPPLTGIADRVYIAGVLPNTPDNLVRWIQHPNQIDSKTAMPDLDVTVSDARDISAYLLTLR